MNIEKILVGNNDSVRKKRDDDDLNPKIRVIGIGGAGCNSLLRLRRLGLYGAETIAINTDQRHLSIAEADKKVLIGKTVTRGLGAGGRPEIGEQCAEQARLVLGELLDGTDLTFIIAGMGGGTGTGVAPIVAEVAKHQGSLVISMATIPFNHERGRMRTASVGLEKLRKRCDSVVVLDNNKLAKIVPDVPLVQAFCVMDQLISEAIKGVTEMITEPSLINRDFADLKTIIGKGSTSTMLYGENADNEPEKVVAEAMNNPFLDVDYRGAKGALLHLTVGSHLPLRTANTVLEEVTSYLDPSANVFYGVRVSPDYEGRVKLLCLMTGVHSPNLLSPDVEFETRNQLDSMGIPTLM